MGYCIGGCFAGKLMQRAPNRVVASVFCQTVGHRPENPTVMYRHSMDNWAPDFQKRRPDVSADTLEKYMHDLYAVQPDFLYSVSRDFIRNCQTPMLVLPDDVPGHPLQTSIDVASLAPNAEITVFPWKEPQELKQRTINRVRAFLRENVPPPEISAHALTSGQAVIFSPPLAASVGMFGWEITTNPAEAANVSRSALRPVACCRAGRSAG
jgi:hypothetical protein